MNETLLEPRYVLVEFRICVVPKYVLLSYFVWFSAILLLVFM